MPNYYWLLSNNIYIYLDKTLDYRVEAQLSFGLYAMLWDTITSKFPFDDYDDSYFMEKE